MDDVFFGSAATPEGVPFGVRPEPPSAGTTEDNGLVAAWTDFIPPSIELVTSDRVANGDEAFFGGEGEEPAKPPGSIDDLIELVKCVGPPGP